MRSVFVLTVLIAAAPARAASFRDLPPEKQSQIFGQIGPVIRQACERVAADHFEDKFTELKSQDTCLAGQADDRELVTYVREEAIERCSSTIEDSIRASEGDHVQVAITPDQYRGLVAEVVRQMQIAACPDRPRP